VADALASPIRRALVSRVARAAGVAAPVLGWLEARAPAPARGEAADLEILYAALTLEHHAIALYEEGLRRSLFPAWLRAYAVDFRGDHQGHRDTQIAIAEERGGRPTSARPRYDLGPLGSSERLIRAALEIEIAAQDAYLALISGIRTDDYLLSAAFILVDEVRHATVWRRVLGIRIY
jgi:rubrerythrin